MRITKQEEGKRGEDYAISYLQKHGYKIIERNFRTRNGEIDIIAVDTTEKPSVLAFIEVKTRSSQRFGKPLESINYFKLQTLKKTAIFYAHIHPNLPTQLRIDAVTVIFDYSNNLKEISLIKNIS
jgi:putative endonuclease